MSSLAGFCTLSHLDLDLPCGYQILAGHAEPAAGHLLDGRAAVILGSCGSKTLIALTTLTGIGLALQMIHGDGQSRMRFLGDGAVGHGTGLEPAYDLVLTLHLFQRDPFLRIVEVQKTPEISCLLCINHFCILLELIIISLSC